MKEKVIYLIDYGIKDELVYQLGWEFRKKRFVLVPFSPADLIEQLIKNKRKAPIVSIIQYRNHLELSRGFNRRFLNKVISHYQMPYVEFTSFSEIIISDKDFMLRNKKEFSLPMSLSDIASVVQNEFEEYFARDFEWPGGRRGSFKEVRES